jgi:hypothetical protein
MSNTGATGFTSNYNDSGYYVTPPTNVATGNTSVYGVMPNLITPSPNVINTTIPSADIYTTTQNIGVYMIDGTPQGTINKFYPIMCSAINLNIIGVPNDVDDAYLVYPGYEFQLFNNLNYGGQASNIYINNTTVPQIFYCGGSSSSWTGYGYTPIYDLGSTSTTYTNNITASILIWFRGNPITISSFSSTFPS